MSNGDSKRVPCTKCGAMVLPLTAKLNDGLCAKCKREEKWAEEDRVRAAKPEPPPPPQNIEISVDEARYDKLQLHLIGEIIRSIKTDLKEAGIAEERVADVTGDIAFSVATIIDGSRVMELEGQPLVPVLTFAEDAERTKLVARAGGSFMHEYVCATVDDLFDEDVGPGK